MIASYQAIQRQRRVQQYHHANKGGKEAAEHRGGESVMWSRNYH